MRRPEIRSASVSTDSIARVENVEPGATTEVAVAAQVLTEVSSARMGWAYSRAGSTTVRVVGVIIRKRRIRRTISKQEK